MPDSDPQTFELRVWAEGVVTTNEEPDTEEQS